MSLTLELSDEQAAVLQAKAAAEGLSRESFRAGLRYKGWRSNSDSRGGRLVLSFTNGKPSPLQARGETGPRHRRREAQCRSASENALLDFQAGSDSKTVKG